MKRSAIKLDNLDIETLDKSEQQQFNNHIQNSTKTEALQIIINSVEGDLTQLSPELAHIAELQELENEQEENKPEVIITVSGGIVQAVGSNGKPVKVVVIDHDNKNEETEEECSISEYEEPDYIFDFLEDEIERAKKDE